MLGLGGPFRALARAAIAAAGARATGGVEASARRQCARAGAGAGARATDDASWRRRRQKCHHHDDRWRRRASGGAGWHDADAEDPDPDGSARRAVEIAIDRTGLFKTMTAARRVGGGDASTSDDDDDDADDARLARLVGLERHLASVIRFRGGPITLAEYMQEALTHPEYGYYMHRDVFGARGDFVTSPEIRCVLYTGPHTTSFAW